MLIRQGVGYGEDAPMWHPNDAMPCKRKPCLKRRGATKKILRRCALTTANIKKKKKLLYYAARSYIFIILAILFFPLVLVVINSFTTGNGFSGSFSLEQWNRLFTNSSGLWRAFGNTMLVGFLAAGTATVIGTAAAIGIQNWKRKPREALLNATQIPVFSADIIIAIAVMFLLTTLGISRGMPAVILVQAAISTPFVILSVMPRIKQMNMSVYEAALDLGATPLSAVRKVVLPEILPGVFTGFAIAFTLSMEDFAIANFNNGGNFHTLSTYIWSNLAGKGGMDGALRAISTLIFLTILTILLLYNFKTSRDLKRGKSKK
jgi:spermidine/putrescine transport system permease protein